MRTNNRAIYHGSALALRLFVLSLGLATTFLPAGPSWAAVFHLVDDNSVASFSTDTQSGAYNWNVDGTSQLYQQWFWFRVGNNPEASIDTLPIASQTATDTDGNLQLDTLFVRYQGSGFQVTVKYSLDGGVLGSGTSDLAEQIGIINQNVMPLDFHFFQYTDFDLQGGQLGDQAMFTNINAVQQSQGITTLAETVITPAASHRRIDVWPNIRNLLNDGMSTNLVDTPIGVMQGPGNLTWAFQWDLTVPGNSQQLISKDKLISGVIIVPEPASWALLALGAIALAFRRRRAN